MFPKILFCVFVTLFFFGETSYLDSLKPCKLEDDKCLKAIIQGMMKHGSDGIPEIGMAPFDPVDLQDLFMNIKDLVRLNLTNGKLKGGKDCDINNFDIHIDDKHANLDITCSVELTGKYDVFSESPVLVAFTGGKSMHGNGNGKCTIDKLRLKIDIFFGFNKKGDDVFVSIKDKKTQYSYELEGIVTFSADSVYLGDQESSKQVMALLNQNYKTVIPIIAKDFLDIAIKLVTKFLKTFFDNVPTRLYLSNDLTPYLD